MALTQVQDQMFSGSTNTTTAIQSNGTTAITIDASQNVGIGTSSPSQKLDVSGTSRYTFNVGNAYTLQTSTNAAVSAFADDYKNALSHIWQTSGTERMRIDSSGNLLVGDTTNSANSRVNIFTTTNTGMTVRNGGIAGNYESSDSGRVNYWQFGRDNSSTGNFVFYLNGSQKGYINLTTGAYVSVSDIRAKKNITPLQYGLSEVLAFNPVMYNMVEELDTDKKHIGLIAQETKSVIDESVDDIKDENTEFYGLDKAGLVPVLIKAIQELNAKVDAQAAEIAALKAK